MEKGDPSINFKNLVIVLIVLNIADSVAELAHPEHDEVGKALDIENIFDLQCAIHTSLDDVT